MKSERFRIPPLTVHATTTLTLQNVHKEKVVFIK